MSGNRLHRAIVTGASGGIGRAAAIMLAERGYEVAVHYNRDADAAEQVVKAITNVGRQAFAFGGDLSDESIARGLVEQTFNHFGGIDLLVNIAGISPKQSDGTRIPTEEMAAEAWDRVMEVNLRSIFLLCKMVIPPMKEQRYGKVINMSSIVGRTGFSGPAAAHYAASKGAIITFSKTLARELGPYGIQVNTVAPGWIETPLTAKIAPDQTDGLLSSIPLGRFGKAEEVAGTIAFLASPEADYITGTTIDINGGWYMN